MLRKLLEQIENGSLPLGCYPTYLLIYGVLAGVGPIEPSWNGSYVFAWKRDLYRDGEFLDRMYVALKNAVDGATEKSTDNYALNSLRLLSSYFGQWQSRYEEITRKIADCALNTCNEQADDRREIKKKEMKRYESVKKQEGLNAMYGLLCYSVLELKSARDITTMLSLATRMNHCLETLKESNANRDQDLALSNFGSLRTECYAVLISRLSDIWSFLSIYSDGKQKLNQVLTDVARGIVGDGIFGAGGSSSCPKWEEVASNASFPSDAQQSKKAVKSGCYFCRHSGKIISINTVSGAVLIDGYPVGTLPESIKTNKTFVRLFGEEFGEVESTKDHSKFCTTQAWNGFYYEFVLLCANKLLVKEIPATASSQQALSSGSAADQDVKGLSFGGETELELVDATGLCLEGELPVFLREMYSHWYDRKTGVVYFRRLHPTRRECDYVMMLDPNQSSTTVLKMPMSNGHRCSLKAAIKIAEKNSLKVNISSSSKKSSDLSAVELLQRVAKPSTREIQQVLSILSKFEDVKYIHIFSSDKDPNSLSLIELPRYELAFEYRNMRFVCCEFKGLVLSTAQTLKDLVPNFRRYLVLENTRTGAIEKIIIPNGEVISLGEYDDCGSCDIQVDNRYSAKLSWFQYDLHQRLGYLECRDIESRLQLAALYAATHSYLPETSSQKTGLEECVRLVRESWTTKPLTPGERVKMSNVFEICRGTTNLSDVSESVQLVLCNLQRTSIDLSFLHKSQSRKSLRGKTITTDTALLGRSDLLKMYCKYTHVMREASRDVCQTLPLPIPLTCDEEKCFGALSTKEVDLSAEPMLSNCITSVHPMSNESMSASCALVSTPSSNNSSKSKSIFIGDELGGDMSGEIEDRDSTSTCSSSEFTFVEEILREGDVKSGGALRNASSENDAKVAVDGAQTEPGVSCFNIKPYITRVEMKLDEAVKEGKRLAPGSEKDLQFPCLMQDFDTPLGKEFCGENEASFKEAVSKQKTMLEIGQNVADRFTVELESVKEARLGISDFVQRCLKAVPTITRPACLNARVRLPKLAKPATESITDVQMLGIMLDKGLIKKFNAFLEGGAIEEVFEAVLFWGELMVLEDKIVRLIKAVCDDDAQDVLLQLSVKRSWSTRDYPYWLVFEVTQRLMIRPEQFAISRSLIDNPGRLEQLTMGKGKTRVILPMMALYFAARDRKRAIRVSILAELLDEFNGHVHQYLTASSLNVKLFRLPFNRSVELDVDCLMKVQHYMDYCASVGGILIVAPEHMQSMLLKSYDISFAEGCQSANYQLISKLLKYPCYDIVDESDEVFRYNKEVSYSGGDSCDLPDGYERFLAVEVVLRVVRDHDGAAVRSLIACGAAVIEPDTEPYRFTPIRLNTSDKEVLKSFHTEIADNIFSCPPHEYGWIDAFSESEKIVLKKIVTDEDADVESLLEVDSALTGIDFSKLQSSQKKSLLALRGLLAFGLLSHALSQRANVNYGINPDGAKDLAVPFRGAGTPAGKNTEYSQPDIANVFTFLAYYYRGLDDCEVIRVFELLLTCGPTAMSERYKTWRGLSECRMSPDDLSKLSSVTKIDLANHRHRELIVKYFKHNFETVNFWLRNYLLPKQTKQYPYKTQCSSWNLADKDFVIGFSGTKDNKRTLPVQLVQNVLPDQSDTDGRMISTILKNPECHVLDRGVSTAAQVLDAILMLAEKVGATVIIDAGAMTAGMPNKDIAAKIMNILKQQGQRQSSGAGDGKNSNPFEKCRGVCYFDELKKYWSILDARGRIEAKDLSSVPESDCFAFYDESRSRGSDLKLGKQVKGLVTLGPKMNKDKLMQGAARLRHLEEHQKIDMVCSYDVGSTIAGPGCAVRTNINISSVDVLKWVIKNACKANENAFTLWATQGSMFATTRDQENIDNVKYDEGLTLEFFYNHSLVMKPMDAIISADVEYFVKRLCKNKVFDGQTNEGSLGDYLSTTSQSIIDQIKQKSKSYVEGLMRQTGRSSLSSENERELEIELEKEAEQKKEVTVMKATPYAEVDWDYSVLLQYESAVHLPIELRSLELGLGNTTCLRGSQLFGGLSNTMFATTNFIKTVTDKTCLDDYLALIDNVVLLPSGDVVVLSSREAEKVFRLLQNTYYATESAGRKVNDPKTATESVQLCGGNRQGVLSAMSGKVLDILGRKSINDDASSSSGSKLVRFVSAQLQLESFLASEYSAVGNGKSKKKIVNKKLLASDSRQSSLRVLKNAMIKCQSDANVLALMQPCFVSPDVVVPLNLYNGGVMFEASALSHSLGHYLSGLVDPYQVKKLLDLRRKNHLFDHSSLEAALMRISKCEHQPSEADMCD